MTGTITSYVQSIINRARKIKSNQNRADAFKSSDWIKEILGKGRLFMTVDIEARIKY